MQTIGDLRLVEVTSVSIELGANTIQTAASTCSATADADVTEPVDSRPEVEVTSERQVMAL